MSEVLAAGPVRKMRTRLEAPVAYELPLGDTLLPMNGLIGESLALEFLGPINCIHCGRITRKSFNQGYCYPCFMRLAQCDSCIVSPEKCHFYEGTCREPEWGEKHCMIDHIVYLANSSGVKVGITRGSQVPTRWMDQGAIQALPIFRVSTRRLSGLLESVYKQHIADKTNWRAMLKGQVDPINLEFERDRLQLLCADGIAALHDEYGLQALQPLLGEDAVELSYPVEEYPVKIASLNLDKTPLVEGCLMGIKGQYLIFDTGVINMRKYGGYTVQLSRA